MGIRDFQSACHKSCHEFCYRDIQIVYLQIVVVLDGKVVLMKLVLKDSRRLCRIGESKMDVPAVLGLQVCKTFLLQKSAMINDSDIVC